MDITLILYFLIAYGVIQLCLIFGLTAWSLRIRRELGNINAVLWDINNEIVHHAVALHDASMLPLPWEAIEQDLEDSALETRIRRNGNVYYLGEDD